VAADRTAIVAHPGAESRGPIVRDLATLGFDVVAARSASDAWRAFRRRSPALVVSAAEPRGFDGFGLLRRIRGVSNVPVILFAEDGDVRTAVRAIRSGATDFFELPADRARLLRDAGALAGSAGLRTDAETLEGDIAGTSAAIERVRERVRALAPLRVPVLVSGEPGSGRDHVVRALHRHSGLAETELIAIAPESAAARTRPGPRAAVYLDHIERFKPELQALWFEILCAAEEPGTAAAPRVYASTSIDVDQAAREGGFHPGLADRLRRFSIPIPSLRDRRADVGPTAHRLANRVGRSFRRNEIRFERGAIALLRQASWPGNVRELARVVERLVAFSIDGEITAQRVREVLGEAPGSVASLRSRRDRRQRDELVDLLESCGGNLAEVARRLEVSRGAVIYRAQKFGLLPRKRTRRRKSAGAARRGK